MKLSNEQLKELEGIYQMSHKCKDSETKKLAKSMLKTINFLDLESYTIDTGYFYYATYDVFGKGEGPQYFRMGDLRSLESLPIIVILYLLTQDDKYLKPSKYIKGSVTVNKEERKYIKFSNTCYFIDKIRGVFKIEDIFK
jgi:hypothetical protein